MAHILKQSQLTSLPNQQEKPHAPSQIYNQRHRITRTPQQIHHRKKALQHPKFHPPHLRRCVNARERAVWGGVEVYGCAADEGCC